MSNEPKAGMNLDPEMLAAYIDKRLSPDQRAAVEAQLATDPDSYAVLVESLKALDEVPDVRTVPAVTTGRVPSLRRWTMAAGLLAAAAAIVLVVRVQPEWMGGPPASDRLLNQLVAAAGAQRSVEPRLSGGFAHAALQPKTRGPQSSAQQSLPLLTAASAAEEAARSAPTAENKHVLGLAQLLLGRGDDAIATLLEAAGAAPTNDDVMSDLSAAYFDRATTTGSTADQQDALMWADRALAIDSRSQVAAFNRALSLEALGRVDDALSAWKFFLDLEPASAWSEEARSRMKALEGASKPVARLTP